MRSRFISEVRSVAGEEPSSTDLFPHASEMSSDAREGLDFADLFLDTSEMSSDVGQESKLTDVDFADLLEMSSDTGEESDFSHADFADLFEIISDAGEESNSTDADFADLFVHKSDLNSVAGGGPDLTDHFPHTSETRSDAGEESDFTDDEFADLFVHEPDLNSVAGEGPDLTDDFLHTSEMRSYVWEESDFSDTVEGYTRRMLVDIRRILGYPCEAIGVMEPRPFDPINPQSNFEPMSPEISHQNLGRQEDLDTEDEEEDNLAGYFKSEIDGLNSMFPEISQQNDEDEEWDNLVAFLRSGIDGLDSMSPEISQQNDEDEEVDNLVEYLRSEMNAANLNNLFDEVDDFLQDLGDNSPIGGNPAASQFVVENLPSILLTDDKMNTLCVVCQDKISSHQEATQLPCLHQYHRHCVCRWLDIRNSCPMCRYELPTDDPEYERSKRRRIN